jgi:hypothetical protein
MDRPRINGSLEAWPNVAKDHKWRALLLGNGLSINVWPDFAYRSLFEQAKDQRGAGALTRRDRKVFEEFRTENFEVALGALNTTIRTVEAAGFDAQPFLESYRSIQAALAEAVRGVHITLSEVPDTARETIKETMERQKIVFTTSYDLLVYWAMGYGEEYGSLVDCFWSNGRCEFDPDDAKVEALKTPVYFLHGGTHLVVESNSVTRKIKRGMRTILEQFGRPIYDDPRARPLLITEGSSADKLRAIEDNVYLAHVLKKLQRCAKPLVVFGSSLGDQDEHLVDAINLHPERPVAISMLPGDRLSLKRQQMQLAARLDTERLYFFNARTHPLGDEDLGKAATAWRKPKAA